MARIPKDPAEAPSAMITVRLSQTDYDRVKEAAYRQRLSLNKFCVNQLLAAAAAELDKPAVLDSLDNQVSRALQPSKLVSA